MDITRIDEQAARLRKIREKRGFQTAKEAADRLGFNYSTYSQHERGHVAITRAAADYARKFKVSEGWLLTGEGESDLSNEVPVMGYLGAGAEVEPEFEQTPPEGLAQVTVPFPLPADMIAFQVRGDSMLPKYDPGDTIIIYKDQQKPVEAFFGLVAAVKTTDGKRYIKTIDRGTKAGHVNLRSWNAALIENVKLDWIGEIFAVLPPAAVRRVVRQGGIQGQLTLKVG